MAALECKSITALQRPRSGKRSLPKPSAGFATFHLFKSRVATRWDLLSEEWPNAKLHRTDQRAAELSNKIFVRPPRNESRPNLRAFVRGTPFQLRVWRSLLN